MTESFCGYSGDRDEALVTYLYDEHDGGPASRAAFHAHLATCVRCSADLAALRSVRTRLARWAPPEPAFASMVGAARGESRIPNAVSRWRAVPAWAQLAAALLLVGVSAGIANLDVRYDHSGLSIRTGWSRARAVADASPAGQASPAPAPWRADLAALERQLKTEFHAEQVAAPGIAAPAAARAATDAEIVRRVRALIDESEKRQQSELALRLAEAIRDVNAQRQADLVKVDRALGTVQNSLGVEVLKTRQQVNLMYRASQIK